jgi:single-strand DNA-binding protein
MNNLNSVLIEGTLSADPEAYQPGFTVFKLLSHRINEDRSTETLSTRISTTGRLSEVCAEYLKKGRGVRVVGRLVQSEAPDCVVIHAEHVEFKPAYIMPEMEVK